MKKAFLFIFILILMGQFSYAQKEFGVKGGVNYSNASYSGFPSGSGIANPSYKIGYHLGAFSAFKLYKVLSVAPELLISEKGVHGMGATYISLPLLLNIRINQLFLIEAGPEFDVLLVGGTLFNPHKYQTFDNGIETGIDIGIKADINENLGAYLRYNYGLSSVMDIQFTDQNGNSTNKVKMYNRNIQISVGYNIFNTN